MSINRDKPDLWKDDVSQSVDLYNDWFMKFAPQTFQKTRAATTTRVEKALAHTDYLKDISVETLSRHPEVLPILRMSTCPPLAQDRLIGLAGVSKNLVDKMEDVSSPRLPVRMTSDRLTFELSRISNVIARLIDPDIFGWLKESRPPRNAEMRRSATIVADRLCGALSDPIIRNAQEKRQLSVIKTILDAKGYCEAPSGTSFDKMPVGSYAFHINIPCLVAEGAESTINVSVDAVIQPRSANYGDFPLLIEAKSAGDFTNVNKRRKEEATKMQQLRNTFGKQVSYTLFLCGYFDSGYLGYEAAEGIDWVWEHRISDLEKLGI